MGFPQVGVDETPASGFVVILFAGFPEDFAFGIVRPCFCIGIMSLFERERFEQPSSLVPCLEDGVNRITKVERGCLWLLELEHVAEIELQPALQKQRQPRS